MASVAEQKRQFVSRSHCWISGGCRPCDIGIMHVDVVVSGTREAAAASLILAQGSLPNPQNRSKTPDNEISKVVDGGKRRWMFC